MASAPQVTSDLWALMTISVANMSIRSMGWQFSALSLLRLFMKTRTNLRILLMTETPQPSNRRWQVWNKDTAIFQQVKPGRSLTGKPCTFICQYESSAINGFSSLWGGNFPTYCTYTMKALFSTKHMVFRSQMKWRVKMWMLVQQLCGCLFLLLLYPGGLTTEQDPVALGAVQL